MKSLAERFDEKWVPEPWTGCWLWTGCVLENGYGYLWPNKKAHRVSWEIHFGPVFKGMHVLHKCDVKTCVNPSHLFLGTHADNMRDCVAKGRNVGGERNKGGGKLSTDQVRAILKATGLHREIAKTFGVSRGMISHIKRRDAWKCVKEL